MIKTITISLITALLLIGCSNYEPKSDSFEDEETGVQFYYPNNIIQQGDGFYNAEDLESEDQDHLLTPEFVIRKSEAKATLDEFIRKEMNPNYNEYETSTETIGQYEYTTLNQKQFDQPGCNFYLEIPEKERFIGFFTIYACDYDSQLKSIISSLTIEQ